MAEIPVYLFIGFLESGKTLFIQETLEDKRFNNGEPTLLLLCEDGEEEYKPDRFSAPNIFIRRIDDRAQLTADRLNEMLRQTGAVRAVVEYNGMWAMRDFYSGIPQNWVPYQTMLFFDARTVLNYNANLRSLVADKIQNADCVIFNRMENGQDFMPFHKLVRALSRRAEIIYDFTDGHIENDELEDPLPFDTDAPVIALEDRDYALWYRDITEDMKKYDGKTIRFKGICAVSPKFPEGFFVCGRHVMTCCADDIAYCGFVTKWSDAKRVENSQWLTVTAKIDIRFSRLYGKRGPILNVLKAESAQAPAEPVATFY